MPRNIFVYNPEMDEFIYQSEGRKMNDSMRGSITICADFPWSDTWQIYCLFTYTLYLNSTLKLAGMKNNLNWFCHMTKRNSHDKSWALTSHTQKPFSTFFLPFPSQIESRINLNIHPKSLNLPECGSITFMRDKSIYEMG